MNLMTRRTLFELPVGRMSESNVASGGHRERSQSWSASQEKLMSGSSTGRIYHTRSTHRPGYWEWRSDSMSRDTFQECSESLCSFDFDL